MNVYETVTNRIVEDLKNGVPSWIKPWKTGGGEIPRNAVSQRNYTGVNVLLLWSEMFEKGYRLPTWLKYKQAQQLGGNVRKGEHGSHIVYASTFHKVGQDENGVFGDNYLVRFDDNYLVRLTDM